MSEQGMGDVRTGRIWWDSQPELPELTQDQLRDLLAWRWRAFVSSLTPPADGDGRTETMGARQMSEQGNFYTDPSRPGRGFCLLIRDGVPFAGTWFDFDRDGNQCWLTLDPPNSDGLHLLRRPVGSGFGDGIYEGAGEPVGSIGFTDEEDGSFIGNYIVDRVKLEGERLEFSPAPPPTYAGSLSLVPVVG